MNGYLLDTNVISELRKADRCNANVRQWVEQLPAAEVYLSVLSLAEIRKGIAQIASRDPVQAIRLENWRATLEEGYEKHGRLLPVTAAVAYVWGDLQGIRTVATMDGLIAATAAANELTLANRNIADFKGLPVKVSNPFDDAPK